MRVLFGNQLSQICFRGKLIRDRSFIFGMGGGGGTFLQHKHFSCGVNVVFVAASSKFLRTISRLMRLIAVYNQYYMQ